MSDPGPHPRQFRMPAEWHRHEATWLAWPHNRDTWPASLLPEVERTYATMIRHLLSGERVQLLVADAAMERHARAALEECGVSDQAVTFHRLPTVDAWIRDYGPTFVLSANHDRLAMVHWHFNGWGNKYPEYERDSEIPARMNEQLLISRFEPGLVFEGGSIDVNGAGTLLTTEQCLLHPNRNPQLQRSEIEQRLRDTLGVRHLVWLGEGLVGDDTDGHVDDLARFVDTHTVVCVVEDDPTDANFALLQQNVERLRRATDEQGHPLNVVTLPMPAPLYTDEVTILRNPASTGDLRRLPASYANFLISNAAVLVPVFDDPNDRPALQTLQRQFPDRKVVGIDARALVFGYGGIHCLTQQQPALG